jgi:pre-mRNA-splicing helicase BRR2
MEDQLRQKQYAYAPNSNLVLSSTRSRKSDLPSGEAEPLQGNLMQKMGDRAIRAAPSTKKRDKSSSSSSSSSGATQGGGGNYKPSTSENKQAYELLLGFVEDEIGNQPIDVMTSCVDEVLRIMLDENISLGERRKLVCELFGKKNLADERFNVLMGLAKRITDFTGDEDEEEKEDELGGAKKKRKGDWNEELGVAVVFDEEDEEQGDEFDIGFKAGGEVSDTVIEVDEDHAEEEKDESDIRIEGVSDEFAVMKDKLEKESEFDLKSIDGFWLQRQISKVFNDALLSQKKSEEILEILSPEKSSRLVENKVSSILGYENFDLIKLILSHRLEIFYCTHLSRASDETERTAIMKKMEESQDSVHILKTLFSKSALKDVKSEKPKSKKIRQNEEFSSASDSATGWGSYYRPSGLLDFESLKFSSEGHVMSNTRWSLPKDSWKRDHKGYQEIYVPAPKAADEKQASITKIRISDMPSWAQPAFKGYDSLNLVQSKLYNTLMFSAENALLCAPTGAGKTNCAVLAMLREIGLYLQKNETSDTISFKVIYIAPMKSLVREMVGTFTERLAGPFGLKVEELSGDQSLSAVQLEETNIIVTTPEKWDIVTRKGVYGNKSFTEQVRLIIFDEIHLLHDGRGPVLESIVARTIRHVEQSQELTRLVGLSATLPNFSDVAVFLRVKPEKGLFVFDNSFRPCPLQQLFIGINHKKAYKKHQLMNEITYEKVIDQRQRKNQIIVFVHSRKETSNTASIIRDMAVEKDSMSLFLREDSASAKILLEESKNVKDESLKSLLQYGFGIHHAGLNRADRALVEDLFRAGHIQVLCSTATLAWGVNLPAHSVLIKGTQVYNPEKASWVELSMLDVMQMLGRAGRPQYDTYGEGMIITSQSELKYYMSLLNEQLPVESQLIARLADSMNAEIALGSIRSIKDAVNWLGYSYLFVRMLQNPFLYSVPIGHEESDPLLIQYRIDLAHTAATLLAKSNLITYDRKSGLLHSSNLGRISSYFYISHNSMQVFNEALKPITSDIEILRIFSLSEEFKYVSVREQEKQELAKLMDQVPIPVKGDIDQASSKINVLLQSYISRLSLEGFSLISDMVFVTQSAGRLMRGLFEIAVSRGWSSTSLRLLGLCKSIEHRMWEIESRLRQFKGVPLEVIKRLEKMNFPWSNFLDLNAAEVGELIRHQKLGKKIHSYTHQIPRLEIEVQIQPITRTLIKIQLSLTPDFMYNYEVHGGSVGFWIFIEDVDSESLLHHEYFILKGQHAKSVHTLNFMIPIYEPQPPQYFVRVFSNNWIGSENFVPISFRNLILPAKFTPSTTLLDLQPLMVSEVNDSMMLDLFKERIVSFNSTQTQAFNSLYEYDENCFISVPQGSGKIVFAEIAICQMLKKDSEAKCIFMSPSDLMCKKAFQTLHHGFGKLDVNVVMLSGDNLTDQKILSNGQIILATVEIWDQVSRRWKTRSKLFSEIRLFVAADLQLIEGDHGPTMESVVSRMRHISSQKNNLIRIIGLSSSVANGKDLAEWIGASSNHTYLFHPETRPVPLDIQLHGLFQNEYEYRVNAMMKPIYYECSQYASKGPVTICVSSRKLSRKLASEILSLTIAQEKGSQFVGINLDDLLNIASEVSNATLKQTVSYGIGFIHSGLDAKDIHIITELYGAGAIQILIIERSLVWSFPHKSSLVIIMDSQYFNSSERRFVDYPVSELSEMIGIASRQGIDFQARAIVFCHTPKKHFLQKFLYEPYPVESRIELALPDQLNSEIVTKTIVNLQGCMDFLTWSFMYRRLLLNPNFYNLHGTSNRHLSDHLSELIERCLDELERSGCISLDEEQVSANNLGFISSYYYLKHTTVEIFNNSLTVKTGLKGILDIITAASEFNDVIVKEFEDIALQKLAKKVRLRTPSQDYEDPHTKVHLLLQAHFSHLTLPSSVTEDQSHIIMESTRFLQAMVDVISSQGWLLPALAAMELHQMVVQGVWNDNENQLYQLPHMSEDIVSRLSQNGIKDIPSFIDADDDLRLELLQLPMKSVQEIAQVCNQYPDIDVSVELATDQKEVACDSVVSVKVHLERDPDSIFSSIHAPRFPKSKVESWWLVVGDGEMEDPDTPRKVYAVKRVTVNQSEMDITIQFSAPSSPGTYDLVAYMISDSYIGFDDEFPIKLEVVFAEDSEEEASDED